MSCPTCGHMQYRCSCGSDHYGCLNFLGDLFMVVITGGIWLIWMFVREMRKNRRC